MQNPIPTEPKKSNTGMIIGISVVVVVVLMCCCAIAVIGGLAMMGPVVGKTFSSIESIPQMPEGFPTISPDMTMPSISDLPTMSPDMTMPSVSDVVPNGGKGDEIQRASAWTYVLVAAASDGCGYSLKAKSTTIKVTQEADAKGVWIEDWTVKCDSGTAKTYSVTFTPGSNGSTDVKVK